ncbi:response regulator transcription factor [Virgibacillus sp. C22-A2]|uniref:Response regulator transcription factor n=1 Tax=Virgibacillus tibetensis TaxID=3042313 RepID=A0ABU6KG54_9BACI|nr:response regulator transcription factor [Virgibacillus sp. C22-A2]
MEKICYVSMAPDTASIQAPLDRQENMTVACLVYSENILDVTQILKPDVLIVDVDGIPTDDVTSLLCKLKEDNPKLKTIGLLPNGKDTCLLHMIEACFDSLLLKTDKLEAAIVDAVKSVLCQRYLMPVEITRAFIEDILQLKVNTINTFYQRLEQHEINLSRREAEVAYLLKQGLKNEQIAKKLQVNEGTVKVHVSHLYSKLKMKGRKNVIVFLEELMSA